MIYRGQTVTPVQAANIAIANFNAHTAAAHRRHQRDRCERLRNWDEMHSALWRQLLRVVGVQV